MAAERAASAFCPPAFPLTPSRRPSAALARLFELGGPGEYPLSVGRMLWDFIGTFYEKAFVWKPALFFSGKEMQIISAF